MYTFLGQFCHDLIPQQRKLKNVANEFGADSVNSFILLTYNIVHWETFGAKNQRLNSVLWERPSFGWQNIQLINIIFKKIHRKSSNCNINQLMMQLSIFPCSCKTNQTCNTIEVTSAQNINKCTHPRCLPFLFMKLTQGSIGIWKSVLAKVFFIERKVQETINKGDKKWFPKFILWSCGFNPKGRLLHEV